MEQLGLFQTEKKKFFFSMFCEEVKWERIKEQEREKFAFSQVLFLESFWVQDLKAQIKVRIILQLTGYKTKAS